MNIFVTANDPIRCAINLDDKTEYWVDIQDYEGKYQISSFGRVKSLERVVDNKNNAVFKREEKILKTSYDQEKRYLHVRLFKEAKSKRFSVHVLVCRHFHPNPLNLPVVNHKDGIKINNYATNVEWTTQLGNVRHAFDTGLMNSVIGENNHNNKLTKEQVNEIRAIGSSQKQRDIAKSYNVSQRLIWNILHNKTWTR